MSVTSPWMSVGILALYYVVLGLLALYGMHRLSLVWAYRRTHGAGPPCPPPPKPWPQVTVQLPIFNEMYVAERLIDAVCALDYPRECLEIQVLDDSTDDTRAVVAQQVATLRAQGHRIHHLTRDDRSGYKAGALAAGQEVAAGDLVAIFDADFVPPRDFLRRTVPHFEDAAVGMVQARWGHLNRDYSLLTRAQAILLDGHFVVEHTARNRSGCFFNFNGTAGVWRRQAIDEAGGWHHDTPDGRPRSFLSCAARRLEVPVLARPRGGPPSCRSMSTHSRASSIVGPKGRSKPGESSSAASCAHQSRCAPSSRRSFT